MVSDRIAAGPGDADVGEAARHWHPELAERIGIPTLKQASSGAFVGTGSSWFSCFGSVAVGDLSTRKRIRFEPATRDRLALVISEGGEPVRFVAAGRQISLGRGMGILLSGELQGHAYLPPGSRQLAVWLPQGKLPKAAPGAALHGPPALDAAEPTVIHLRQYLHLLRHVAAVPAGADLAHHIEATLIDLVALAVRPHGTAEIPAARGRRAAKLRAVLSEIDACYADPGFSINTIAARLALSPRYIQDLLGRNGATFTERLREVRLQAAHRMLSDPRFDHLRVGEVAFEVGFNEISHFNHGFRARFGATPKEVRSR